MDIKELYDLYLNNPECFKTTVLHRNLLGIPNSYKCSDSDLEILSDLVLSIDDGYNSGFLHIMLELALAFELIFTNMKKLNDARYKTDFMEYSLDCQLKVLLTLFEELHKYGVESSKISNNGHMRSTDYLVVNIDTVSGVKYSASQISENLLETIDKLIPFLHYHDKESKNLKTNTIGQIVQNKDTNAFIYYSNSSGVINDLWSLIMYKDYGIFDDNGIFVFAPNNYDTMKIDFIASIRRERRLYNNLMTSLMHKQETVISSNQYKQRFAGNIGIDTWTQIFEMEPETYLECSLAAKTIIKIVKDSNILPFYLRQRVAFGTLDDFLEMFGFLFTMSQLYTCILNDNRDELAGDRYEHLCPAVDIDLLADSYSRLYNKKKQIARALLDWFIYLPERGKEGDLFTKPLVKISGNKVLFPPNLVQIININRMLEQIMLDYKIKRASFGDDYETYLRNKLSLSTLWNVYAGKIAFKSSLGNTDFDVLALLDDYVIIIEIKHLITPYDPKRYHDDRKEIKKAAEQLKKRKRILRNDWSLIREITNGFLPEPPYPEEKIITLICTNIDSFTSLKMDGIPIIDESALSGFFEKNGQYIEVRNGTGIIRKEKIWEHEKPNISDLQRYITTPAVIKMHEELVGNRTELIATIGEDDNRIAIMNYFLKHDWV